MTTSEFIKQLQESDPTGEAIISFGGYYVSHMYRCPGYYDGCYNFLNNDGQLVFDTQKQKVTIWLETIGDYVHNLVEELDGPVINPYTDPINPARVEEIWTNEILSRLVFNSISIHSKDSVIERARKAFDQQIDYLKKEAVDQKWLFKVEKKIEDGYRYFVNTKKDFWNWKVIDNQGVQHGVQGGEITPLLYSGLFEMTEECVLGEYREVKLKI